jgi:uncharacterized membrane protein YgaE (UPF0421/DUF939 family)
VVTRSARRRAAAALRRVREAGWPAVQASIGAALAWTIGQQLLGHPRPFFAAVATWVCLGLTDDRRLRRVAELAIGVTIGIAVGEVVLISLGLGPLGIAVVLATTVVITQAVDGRPLVSTQAGVQALLIVTLPQQPGGAVSRWQDAFVGGAVAVLVALLLPSDPRTLPRRRVGALLDVLAEVLALLATALREGDHAAAERALQRARSTQPLVDALDSATRGSHDVSRASPVRRQHRGEVDALERAATTADRAVRNARVFARRVAHSLGEGEVLGDLGEAVADTVVAVGDLRSDLASGGNALRARAELKHVAARLSPAELGRDNPAAPALVYQLRSLVVDLLESTGLDHDEARTHLPPLT